MKSCPKCGRGMKRAIKGGCRACYQRNRYRNAPPARCHSNRKEHAGGLCRQCYRSGKRAPKATCHPDRSHAANGLCKRCYNELPENKARAIKVRRLKKYGLSHNEYLGLLRAQGGQCAVCEEKPEVVDHDHQTGRVRGLLCRKCNIGIGHLRDDPGVLRAAVRYLEAAA